jgi:hypothetical protein
MPRSIAPPLAHDEIVVERDPGTIEPLAGVRECQVRGLLLSLHLLHPLNGAKLYALPH